MFELKLRYLQNLNTSFNKTSSTYLAISIRIRKAFKQHGLNELRKVLGIIKKSFFFLTHVLFLPDSRSDNQYFKLQFRLFYFWTHMFFLHILNVLGVDFKDVSNFRGLKCIGVIIQIGNMSLLLHFFSP